MKDYDIDPDCNDVAAEAQAILDKCCGTRKSSCQNTGQGSRFGPAISLRDGRDGREFNTVISEDRC